MRPRGAENATDPQPWGWDYSLSVDLWRARHHGYLTDISLVWRGHRVVAHRLLLSLRSLPLAGLIEKLPSSAPDDEPPEVCIDGLMEGALVPAGADAGAALEAVVEFLTSDLLSELPLPEMLLVCELGKRLHAVFLFGTAARVALHMLAAQPPGSPWGAAANALWVAPNSELHRMLTEHASELQMPFDAFLAGLQRDAPATLTPAACADASPEVLCALLSADWPECPLPAAQLEPLLLDAALAWGVRRAPYEAAAVVRLVKVPLLPEEQVARALHRHGAQQHLLGAADDVTARPGAPGSRLWRRTPRYTGVGGAASAQPIGGPVGHGQPAAEPPPAAACDYSGVSTQPTPPSLLAACGVAPGGGTRRASPSRGQPAAAPRRGRTANPHDDAARRRVDFSPQGSTDRSDSGVGDAVHCGSTDEDAARWRGAARRRQRQAAKAAEGCGPRGTQAWPDSVLQNGGRPPVRYHEHRDPSRRSDARATLSTMLWESSLRPQQGVGARQRSVSAGRAGRASPPRQPWRGPRAPT